MKKIIGLFIFSTILFSCKNDINLGNSLSGDQMALALPYQENDQLAICYDIITSQHVEARYLSDTANLSFTDKVFRAPEFSGAHVEMIVRENGEIDANIQMKQFEEMPIYPENRLNNNSLPEDKAIDRIELRGSEVDCYNSNGEVIGSGSMDPITLGIIESTENLQEALSYSEAEQEMIVQAFEDAGMNMQSTELDGVYLYEQLFDNGESMKLLFDMERGLQLAQASYKSNGELDSKSNMYYDQTDDGKQIVTGHRFVTYLESPSSGTELAITRRSKIFNFQMQNQ
jgi:hypothetical protein